MMDKKYVVAIGNVSADNYYRCLQDIVVGDKFFVRFQETLPGGMVANAACVMSMLGTPVFMFTALGDDEDTELLLGSFTKYGVDTCFVHVLPGCVNMRTAILLNPDNGERTIMLYENRQKPVAVLDEDACKTLKNASFIYGLMSDFKTFPNHQQLFSACKSNGVRIMLDAECSTFTSGACIDDQFYFELADIISLNEVAAEQYGSEEDLNKLSYARIVLVTLGSQGCRILSNGQEIRLPAYDIVPEDTTGAGDTFNGAFLHAYLAGWPLLETGRFAIAAANRSILYTGARSGAVTQNEVENFMKQHV